MSPRPRFPAAAGALLLGVLFSACGKKPVAAAPPPPNVGVVTAIQKDVPIYGEWVATLDGMVNANIQPEVAGYLIKQVYREGTLVHKDEVLFEIDPRPFQNALAQAQGQVAQSRGQLAQAQAQLGLAQINVRRDTPLAAAHAIAQSQLDNEIQARAQAAAQVKTSEASIQSAEAAAQQAELNLNFTKVRSLVDGIAGLATTQVGSLVGASTVLTTVSQVDPIRVYFPISEQEYLAIADKLKPNPNGDFLSPKHGVALQLTLANGDVYPHTGRIIFADRQVDTQTGTIRVVGVFPNPGNILRPGQYGRIRAMTGYRKDAILVPQRAVNELQGRNQVVVVGPGNKVHVRSVEVGERVGPSWIISSGLSAGDRVVTEGIAKIRDGMTVTPQPDDSESERQP